MIRVNLLYKNLNLRDNHGWTPLHYAASNGHIHVCQYIAKNLTEKNPITNNGETPHQLIIKFSEGIFQPKS